jgi:DNA-directed RNA polymerase subunit RPC12/RpoP
MKFDQPAYPTVYFSEKIWVKCPKCSEPALVKTTLPSYTVPIPLRYSSNCSCKSCGFQEQNNEEWYGYYQGFVNQPCKTCGSKISNSTEPTKKPYKNSDITCKVCNSKRTYELKWYRYRKDRTTDPYFGFDLWIQTTIKNNVLWLYNLDHLEYLKAYVTSKLREDNGRHKYSMITNLPQWIKSSKNREVIVKKLNTLKLEFQKKNLQ